MIKLKDILLEQQSESKQIITDLFIGQARPKFNMDYILQNFSTAGEKIASKILKGTKAIDIEVTKKMSTGDVINKIKELANADLLVPGKLNSITISSHNTGCGKFNYDIALGASPFWSELAKYCNSNTKIFLGGCSVADNPTVVAEIAKITNCTVTAPTGTYFPVTGLVSKTQDITNLSQRLGKYLTCTNKPEGDSDIYHSFIHGNHRYLFDPDSKPSAGKAISIIKDFHEKLNYPNRTEEAKKDQESISTILEELTIQLVTDYLKSLGCSASKENPIQGTRQAIFK